MARVYKCHECKLNILTEEAISDNGNHYHTKCYAKVLDRKNLVAYVCKLFGLKAPGPVIYAQRKTFAEKYGYTDAGMLKTLIYLYDIKKTKIDGAQERIGLIPYAYDEAQEYFKAEEFKKQEIAHKMAEAIRNQKIEIIHVKQLRPQEKKKDIISPDQILSMKDEE